MNVKLFIIWIFSVFLMISVGPKAFAYNLIGLSWPGATTTLHSNGFRGSNSSFNTAIPWDVHNGPASNFDFKRVAIHELGHALGLDHDDRLPAIMNTFYSQAIETLQVDDINGLRALYGGTGNTNFNDVIIDFGPGFGIWVRRNDVSWEQLHTLSPEIMATGNMDGN